MIKLLEPIFKGKEQSFVRKCIKSGWITTGSFVEKFENKVKKYIGAKHAIACINGTSALHIALKLSKVKSNDEVIVPTLTFIAPVNAIIYNNAVPIFMDADQYYNIDQEKTINFINNETFIKNKNCYNKKTKRKISALIIVHVFGNAAKFDKLYKYVRKKILKLSKMLLKVLEHIINQVYLKKSTVEQYQRLHAYLLTVTRLLVQVEAV